jgi:hypothetical protein
MLSDTDCGLVFGLSNEPFFFDIEHYKKLEK